MGGNKPEEIEIISAQKAQTISEVKKRLKSHEQKMSAWKQVADNIKEAAELGQESTYIELDYGYSKYIDDIKHELIGLKYTIENFNNGLRISWEK